MFGLPRGTKRTLALAGIVLLSAILACSGEPGPASGPGGPRETVSGQQMLMGTVFGVKLVTDDPDFGHQAIRDAFEEVARVEALLSEWQETSEISEVNRAAGKRAVVVGSELLELVVRAGEISVATSGAFDITFAGCGRLWSFREPKIPSDEELAACLPSIGFGRVETDVAASSILLPDAAMRIGIAGIGKGYGVDRAAEILEVRGIMDYIEEGGGDIRIRGGNVDGPWTIGIAHPRERGELFATMNADRGSVVTSGDYESYFERDGLLYHHILDPRTGQPARGAVAVTVLAKTAMDADALATGLFVLGVEEGLARVEDLADVEALFFAPDLSIHASSGFPAYDPLE